MYFFSECTEFKIHTITMYSSTHLLPCNVISVIYAWAFLLIWTQFWDWFALFYNLCPYFSDYTWFLLVRVLILDLRVSRQMLGESREVEAKPSSERLQKRPNRPKMDDLRQNPRTKKMHKMRRSGSGRARQAKAHHGRGGRVFPQLLRFPSRPFVFLHDIFVLCCYVSFKRGCI